MVTSMLSRSLVAAAFVAGAAFASPAMAQQKTLTISMWGFNGDKLRQFLFEPFEKANNVKIVLEEGNAGDRLNKIKIRKGGVDLVYLSDIVSQTGIEDGVLEKIDPSKLPNLADIYPFAQAPQGKDYGPAYTLGRIGVIYDSAKVNVTAFADLWKPEFKNKISIPGFPTTAGPTMILIAGKVKGVDAFANPDAAFKSLAELKPNVVKSYSTGSEVVNMFSTGEIVATVGQDFTLAAIQKAVPTVKWAELKEGDFATYNTINLVKNGTNKDLALAFINWHLSAEVQKNLAVAGTDGPSNTKVELTPAQAAPWAYGEKVIKSLNVVDYAKLNAAKPAWGDKWNEVMGK